MGRLKERCSCEPVQLCASRAEQMSGVHGFLGTTQRCTSSLVVRQSRSRLQALLSGCVQRVGTPLMGAARRRAAAASRGGHACASLAETPLVQAGLQSLERSQLRSRPATPPQTSTFTTT